MKKLICLACFLILPVCLFAQETLTISTYYPSPYGSYKDLQTETLTLGDNVASPQVGGVATFVPSLSAPATPVEGMMYYDNGTHQFKYRNNTTTWQNLGGISVPGAGTIAASSSGLNLGSGFKVLDITVQTNRATCYTSGSNVICFSQFSSGGVSRWSATLDGTYRGQVTCAAAPGSCLEFRVVSGNVYINTGTDQEGYYIKLN